MGRPDTLDLLDTGVIRLDSLGQITEMNQAAEQCLMAGRERARGRRMEEVAYVPLELRDAIDAASADGQGRRLHELRLGQGFFDCTIELAEDKTLVLEFHNLEWEQTRFRLQQREVQTGMLELLSRNLGHEIRNPLGGIRGAAQMLAGELVVPELTTLARLIMREVDRIDELLMRFGQPEIASEDVDIYPLLDEVLDLLQAEFGDAVRIERDFDPSIPQIKGDAPAIRQVILNLLRNAYQAHATQVLIRTRVEYGHALLQSEQSSVLKLDVIDDGVGVPESLQSMLFLPLVTGRRDGTGLGLALAQQIASAHGGLMTFEPLDGLANGISSGGSGAGGSRFTLYLPLPNGDD
jgi:two-component system nitrogen regulation sensor histidine kinase GlnL